MLANLLAMLGLGAANAGSQACWFLMVDEAECPESLIK
ncbi:MAG: cyclic lactone autoinducer peptide [Bacilli bacterium]|nr:cyclic lactone autoinducer peptide [Bacilli bacterium]